MLGLAHQQLSEFVRIVETPSEWEIKAESIMSKEAKDGIRV